MRKTRLFNCNTLIDIKAWALPKNNTFPLAFGVDCQLVKWNGLHLCNLAILFLASVCKQGTLDSLYNQSIQELVGIKLASTLHTKLKTQSTVYELV